MDATTNIDGNISLTRCMGLTFRVLRPHNDARAQLFGQYQVIDSKRALFAS
ncbi:MAG: hypothetical protein H6686_07285 [Fibrobacteria bacterium]|nr:hypothetical protein [Fibrobacteria bacterium]